MKLELLVFGGLGLYLYDVWYETHYIERLLSYQKYYKAIGITCAVIAVYILIKNRPSTSAKLLHRTSAWISSLPISKKTARRAIDLTGEVINVSVEPPSAPASSYARPIQGRYAPTPAYVDTTPFNGAIPPIVGKKDEGGRVTKRSVSETRKKYVASSQNWRCSQCLNQLSHTFEVDHRVRLDKGGTNDPSNLVAMCRECHGAKTAMENM